MDKINDHIVVSQTGRGIYCLSFIVLLIVILVCGCGSSTPAELDGSVTEDGSELDGELDSETEELPAVDEIDDIDVDLGENDADDGGLVDEEQDLEDLGEEARDQEQSQDMISVDLEVVDLILPPYAEPILPTLPEGITVRAMTFNVHEAQDAPATAIGQFLQQMDMDIVGLQECGADIRQEISQAAGYDYQYGSGNALLSKTPLENPRQIYLDSGRGYVHATTQISGVNFSVYSAHFGWNQDGDDQCREFIDQHLSQDPNPYLLILGDFNDEHYSTQITILEEELQEAFTSLGWFPGERISWPATGFDGSEGSQLIDLIFYRKDFFALVLDGDVSNLSPVLSDHKPAWVELLYPAADDQPFGEDPFSEMRDPMRHIPPPDQRPPNLLTNPGAENDLEGWTTEGEPEATAWRQQQAPYSGGKLFTGFFMKIVVDPILSLAHQTVDISDQAAMIDQRRSRLYLSAMMATGYYLNISDGVGGNKVNHLDDGEIILECLDANDQLLFRTPSQRRDTLGWHPYSLAVDVPAGTRKVKITWISHRRIINGSGSDAVFDDLYLGHQVLEQPHSRLSGNLVLNSGAEGGDMHWETNGFGQQDDLVYYGAYLFPPWSYSGRGYFFGGDPTSGVTGEAYMAQDIELNSYTEQQAEGTLALRWGGVLRTWAAKTYLQMSLEIYDGDGSLWGVVEADPVRAAEWTKSEQLTRIPRGASRLRLVLKSDLQNSAWGVYADELFAIFEEVAPMPDD
jgi:endonuclease/exonuclease/phosphatase family metal-dependent hydrolase